MGDGLCTDLISLSLVCSGSLLDSESVVAIFIVCGKHETIQDIAYCSHLNDFKIPISFTAKVTVHIDVPFDIQTVPT